ncbi:MAG: 4'-phosphopantetheinyl transferase superfamily protein [Sulfuricaulis sp.]|uniref:4'-phosphopantetheinyl transferase family protein n=1 Tax=Sulfuricaulis sp. TaxID=2003553 RepID=UPI0025CF6302|nr:4'-phosphopantetheinyl transferase superfamily protein [Sulfuricaulis sp.]MCR4347655.1 4'-phosphopantetheinyl transferase superfamily protein [Sulfuricaulis sp.]
MSRHIISTEENWSSRNSPGAAGHKSVEYGYTPTFQNNPASPSSLLASLFPPGVAAAELRTAGDPSLLLPDEAKQLVRAVPKRMQEFAAGRLCARRALAEFGFIDYPLRMHSDRRPQWPDTVVGSISHTTGMCGAVVARQSQFRAIGLDMEIVGQVTPEIWPTICTPEEMVWLAALRELEQVRCAAIIFSAKESFYKCQNGVTRQWLEYDDVTVDIPANYASSGCFALRPRRSIALLEYDTKSWKGRFEFHGNLVVTGMVLEAR